MATGDGGMPLGANGTGDSGDCESGDNRGSDDVEGDGFSVVKRARGGAKNGNNNVNGRQNVQDKRDVRRDESGLLSNRQRGFSASKFSTRVPTSNLQDMQAKDGALV